GVLKSDPEKFSQLETYLLSLPLSDDKERNRSYLIPTLRFAQDIYTFLPESVQLHIANALKLHLSEVFGVISFYAYFTTKQPGKHRINICCGTACHVKGSAAIMNAVARTVGLGSEQITSDDKMFTVERVSCIGACGLAPVVLVNGDVYGQPTAEQIVKIVNEIREAEQGKEK
ncbi:MAG: NAD(P)H-dependent oxidoreductase subunit E, partial [Lentisphaeria bacterium]